MLRTVGSGVSQLKAYNNREIGNRCGDSVGYTVVENSSVFTLI